MAQAVEQFMVERAVLPIENSLGVRPRALAQRATQALTLCTASRLQGSIHRNYDLLLRHRLHIVGEVRHTSTLESIPTPAPCGLNMHPFFLSAGQLESEPLLAGAPRDH